MNLTDSFTNYLCDLSSRLLPESAVTQAKKCLLDYIGVTYAGQAYISERFASYIATRPDGNATILGAGRMTDGLFAAFINAFSAHVLELDDGHRFGMIHLAAPVISAVLAAAQSLRFSGNQLIKGIVVGYEAAIRLASSIQPAHKTRGFHTAGTCGTVGASAGIAAAMGLDKERFKSVISVAVTSAAGLLEIQEDGSELKPYNVANAAMCGYQAALVGSLGFVSPDDILDGSRGFSKVLADGMNKEILLRDSPTLEIERVYLKPYAACRHAHSAIEAAIMLRKKVGIQPANIQRITVETYGLAVRGHDHVKIQGVQSAKLSIPYSVAAAYTLGKCGIEVFSAEAIKNEDFLLLTKKVSVHENRDYSKASPERRIAEVVLVDKDNKEYRSRIDHAKGDPENPMTEEEIETKFREMLLASHVTDTAYDIIDAIRTIEGSAERFYSLLQ